MKLHGKIETNGKDVKQIELQQHNNLDTTVDIKIHSAITLAPNVNENNHTLHPVSW